MFQDLLIILTIPWASLVAQMVKNLPAIQETHVRSLGQEDPLQKGMATHPNVLAWEISRTEEPGGLQFMGSQRVGHNFFRKILRISQVVLAVRNTPANSGDT